MPRRTLVLATRNAKKVVELRELLAPFDLEVAALADVGGGVDVVEDGETFSENAAKKAIQQALHLKQWTLGEDSGLCVHALDNAPGVRSARFAGEQGNDAANNRRLLTELVDVPLPARTAHYVCSMVLCDATGKVHARSEGRCYGRILTNELGGQGFGYDPLFEVVEYHRTFGQLGLVVKSAISHRARALRKMVDQIEWLIGRGVWKAE